MARKRRTFGKGASGPWVGNEAQRVGFERNAFLLYQTLQVVADQSAVRAYRVIVDVPHYEPRTVQVRLERTRPRTPVVTVDGPTDSPHRYSDGSLCMWYPNDPATQRWVFANGLPALIGHIQAHLFREAWRREYGWWPGAEAGHSPRVRSEAASE